MKFDANLLRHLRRGPLVTVLTGAGMSAESGIPTFRDAQTGLWANYSPEDLATPNAFARDPQLVWNWYAHRRTLVQAAQPNAGHYALAQLAKRVPLTLITQNVDGLHQRAGSAQVFELHGSLLRVRCSESGEYVATWDDKETPPRHPTSGALLRPDVVWFGEMLPEEPLHAAYDAAKNCEIFLLIGTSALVYPAADLPRIALAAGATVIEINPSATPLSSQVQHCWRDPVGTVLPALIAALDDETRAS